MKIIVDISKMKNVRYIIGMDIGHGESTASMVDLQGGSKEPIPLLLNNNGDKKVMTTLSNDLIGGNENCYVYFKKNPTRWNEVYAEDTKIGDRTKRFKYQITYGELLEIFIRIFYGRIFDNENGAICNLSDEERKDKIAVFVGCPSDPVWIDNKDKYEELIKRATGLNHVAVVPESTAAIFSTVKTQKLSPQSGIIVFDFGSSTSDCTYLQLGKRIVEKSWTLGASEIEKNMLNYVCTNCEKIKPEDIIKIDRSNSWLRLRKDVKEAWFGDDNIPGIKDSKYKSKTILHDINGTEELLASYVFTLNSEFIEQVCGKDTVAGISDNGVKENDKDVDSLYSINDRSWKGYCKKFMEVCKAKLDDMGQPYKAVMLTGGASKMDFVKNLCEEVFDEDAIKIVCDTSPSFCVSKGLCQFAINQLAMCGNTESVNNTKSGFLKNITDNRNMYITKVTKTIGDKIYDFTLDILDECNCLTTVSEYQQALTQVINKNINQEYMSGIIKSPLNDFVSDIKSTISTTANSIAKELYENDDISGLFTLQADDYPIDVSDFYVYGNNLISNADLKSISFIIVELMLYILAAIIDVICIPFVWLGNRAIDVYNWIFDEDKVHIDYDNYQQITQDLLNNPNRHLGPINDIGPVKGIKSRLIDNADDIKKGNIYPIVGDKIEKIVKNQVNEFGDDNKIKGVFDIIAGKVSLTYFDDQEVNNV